MTDWNSSSRRTFLRRLARAGLGAPLLSRATELWAQSPSAPTGVRVGTPLAKSLLRQDDFSFVGAFALPSVGGASTEWGYGLTHRYINGQVYLLSFAADKVFGVSVPALRTSAPWNEALVTHNWGVVQNAWLEAPPVNDPTLGSGADHSTMLGLLWDEERQRLYWAYQQWYVVAPWGNDCCFGFSTLRDNGLSGSGTPYGPWRMLPSIGSKVIKGFVQIPADFADSYCRGRRLGIGGGGYESVVSVGPASMGPALFAIDHPAADSPVRTQVATATTLVNYPFGVEPCHRNPNYRTEYDQWAPSNGVGYFTWSDMMKQSMAWVDTGTKHGLVFIPTLGQGRVWYESSDRHAEGGSHAFMVYDPADLARVARGETAPYQIQAKNVWAHQFPGLPTPLSAYDGEATQIAHGATFDATSGRLYVRVILAYTAAGENVNQRRSVVYVYQVNR